MKLLLGLSFTLLGGVLGCQTPGEGFVADDTTNASTGPGNGTTSGSTTDGNTTATTGGGSETSGSGGSSTSSTSSGATSSTDTSSTDTSSTDSGSGGAGTSGPTTVSTATTGSASCEPSALILVQRSGAMVQAINEEAGSEGWWDYVQPLIVGSGGIVETHGGEVSLAAGTFYTLEGGACPNLEATAFTSDSATLDGYLTTARSAAEATVADEVKSDSPVGAAVSGAVPLLTGQPGAKYLVLLLYGFPDSCNGIDAPHCFADEAIKAVQDARAAGVTTIPILLDGPGVTEAPDYAWYGQALANAGAGNPLGPIEDTLTPGDDCPTSTLSADYADSPGSTTLHLVPERDQAALASALSEAFSRIQSCQ